MNNIIQWLTEVAINTGGERYFMRILKTWAERSNFSYAGSVKQGTQITYGRGYSLSLSTTQYAELLDHFLGDTVDIGTSRTNPPRGSVGEWLQSNVTKTAIASYVGPILIAEGYAKKVGGSKIMFKTSRERLEGKVKKELRLWIKAQHPSWLIYPRSAGPPTLSKGHPRQAYRFSPNIDVLAFYEGGNKLIGFEVKAPIYRYKNFYFFYDEKGNIMGWQPYTNPLIRKLKKEDKIDEKRIKTEARLGIIYESIGEAFFNLRYVDLSFIVLPELKEFCPGHSHPVFLSLLLKKTLPLGLIEFEYCFSPSSSPGLKISEIDLRIKRFKESYKAKSSLIWKDYDTYMGYREDNFVWEERGKEFKKGDAVGISGPAGTFRDRLIDMIKKDHIS